MSTHPRQRAAPSPPSRRPALTIWQLRNRRALVVGPPIALDDLKQGPFGGLLGCLHACILVFADPVPRRRCGSRAAPQSDSLQRVPVGAGGARARRIARVATLGRLRRPPQPTRVRLQGVLQVMVEALSMLGGGGGGRGVFWRRNVLDYLCRLGLHITIGGACRECRRPSSDAVLSQD
jgi:hypothetical protein